MEAGSLTTNASHLASRVNINERLSKRDLNEWIKSFVKIKDGEQVLDVCCGTGKQLLMYFEAVGARGEVHGLDASAEALDHIRKSLPAKASNVVLHHGYMEEIPQLLVDYQGTFDWVTCTYGLYYSKSAEKTLSALKTLLKADGRLVIVGPTRGNNRQFYDLVGSVSTIPEFVIFSSTVFMDTVVIPKCRKLFKFIEICEFQNEIVYPDIENVVSYWKSCGTYYDDRALPKFTQLVEQYFQQKGNFQVTKEALGIVCSD